MKRIVSISMVFLLSASIALAQDICESDFDCSGSVDANDATKFLEDFGRSQHNNPCPPCVPPVLVPLTGQTNCYDELGNPRDCAGTGEDGEHQVGFAGLTDNGDGTITDTLTGLMWLKDANCIATNYPELDNDSTPGDGKLRWQTALDFVSGINDGTYPLCGAGYADWRLPNINVLKSRKVYGPNLAFANVKFEPYWSSTTDADFTARAWYVSINPGYVSDGAKSTDLYVWPVRGGQ